MARMFGTDGVRGVANTELDSLLAYQLGRAGAQVLMGEAKKPVVRRASERIGRNEPCPCGSGKKYKKCCGKA